MKKNFSKNLKKIFYKKLYFSISQFIVYDFCFAKRKLILFTIQILTKRFNILLSKYVDNENSIFNEKLKHCHF